MRELEGTITLNRAHATLPGDGTARFRDSCMDLSQLQARLMARAAQSEQS